MCNYNAISNNFYEELNKVVRDNSLIIENYDKLKRNSIFRTILNIMIVFVNATIVTAMA